MIDQLFKYLLAGEVMVIFRKKENNLIRNLLCTLNTSLIPPEQYDVLSFAIEPKNENLLLVWDIEGQDWRSFYIDSIISLDLVEIKDESPLQDQ
jgi:hypothetical protein